MAGISLLARYTRCALKPIGFNISANRENQSFPDPFPVQFREQLTFPVCHIKHLMLLILFWWRWRELNPRLGVFDKTDLQV